MKSLSLVALQICASFALLVAGGCASTPQETLDQANNGAALTMSLEAEIRQFRVIQASVMKARLDAVRNQQLSLSSYEIDAAFDEKLLSAAGKDGAMKLYKQLLDLSELKVQAEKSRDANQSKLNDDFNKLLAALPDSTKEIVEARKALSKLGEQLSTKERIAIVSAFAKEVQKAVADNAEKIDAAKEAAPTAKNQPQNNPTKISK